MGSGTLKDVFDGEPRTLARFDELNPVILELRFSQPRRIAQVNLLLASGNWEATARMTAPGSATAAGESDAPAAPDEVVVSGSARSPRSDSWLDLAVPAPDGALAATALRLEIRPLDDNDAPIIHLRELRLR
jgi:hypothetical protein